MAASSSSANRSGLVARMLDRIVRDVRYACRSLLRTPLVTLTVVTTVGLGLGLVAVVFTVLNAAVFRADEVRDPHELFAVVRQASANAPAEGFSREDYAALVRETIVFSEAFASTLDIGVRIDGAKREGRFVTGSFFQALGTGAARGRTLTRADDEPGAAPALVLSDHAWANYFARDPNVLGRSVRLNGAPFEIVGVMPPGFRGLRPIAAPDFWAALAQLDQVRSGAESGDSVDLEIVGRLAAGLSSGQAVAQLAAWDSVRMAERPADRRPATGVVLEPRRGTIRPSAEVSLLFTPLFFAFGLVLMIACANVANLLLARGVARQREIGIRLAIGAARRRVVWQLLTEGLLLALASAAFAFVISRLVLAGVFHAIASTSPMGLTDFRIEVPPADWRVALFLFAGAIGSPLLFALAPALQATRPNLVRAIHGAALGDAHPGGARSTLVTVQVTAAVLLLICTAIFLRAAWDAAIVDSGIRTDGIVNVAVLEEDQRSTILDAVNADPSVAAVGASYPGWVSEPLGGLRGFAEGASSRRSVRYQFISPEYLGILGIDLIRGRGFTQSERSANDAVALVSENVARELWPTADPIGQVVRVEPDLPVELQQRENTLLQPRTAVVVGVVRDVAGFRLGNLRLGANGVYLPIDGAAASTSLTISVRGDVDRARLALADRLAGIDPDMAEVAALQTIAGAQTYLLGIPLSVTLVLGVLALFLTVSGLFSVLSYAVVQRTREIGVRAALGATHARIGFFVLSQCARPVGSGLLVGSSLVVGVSAALLATPAAEQLGAIVSLLDPVPYVASMLCVVGACGCAALLPAMRAGRIDPVVALRQD